MKTAFEKIKVSHLCSLCSIVSESKFCKTSYIRRKYAESGTSFDETLSFLEKLGVLKIDSGELFYRNGSLFETFKINEFRNRILQKLFTTNNDEIFSQLKDFLSNFNVEDSRMMFHATPSEKLRYSNVRNLLLELEFISISSDKKSYFVNPTYWDLFFKIFNKRKLSVESFKKKQCENEKIGLNAEVAIIEYELKRLENSKIGKNDIEHTSKQNILAGYDIKSFEDHLDSNSNKIFRHIEVKAVSIIDYNFFWSRNEMETAKIYGDTYFLYLLPILSKTKFDFKAMKIIQNPYKVIYLNDSIWNRQVESFSFSKKVLK